MEKDLGLMVHGDLNWNHHLDKASAKAFRLFHMIKRNAANFSYQSKLDSYKSMIVPTFLYASCFCGLTVYVSRQLVNLQKLIVQWIPRKKHIY